MNEIDRLASLLHVEEKLRELGFECLRTEIMLELSELEAEAKARLDDLKASATAAEGEAQGLTGNTELETIEEGEKAWPTKPEPQNAAESSQATRRM